MQKLRRLILPDSFLVRIRAAFSSDCLNHVFAHVFQVRRSEVTAEVQPRRPRSAPFTHRCIVAPVILGQFAFDQTHYTPAANTICALHIYRRRQQRHFFQSQNIIHGLSRHLKRILLDYISPPFKASVLQALDALFGRNGHLKVYIAKVATGPGSALNGRTVISEGRLREREVRLLLMVLTGRVTDSYRQQSRSYADRSLQTQL